MNPSEDPTPAPSNDSDIYATIGRLSEQWGNFSPEFRKFIGPADFATRQGVEIPLEYFNDYLAVMNTTDLIDVLFNPANAELTLENPQQFPFIHQVAKMAARWYQLDPSERSRENRETFARNMGIEIPPDRVDEFHSLLDHYEARMDGEDLT